jgi:lysophospholipase L1-like esterase
MRSPKWPLCLWSLQLLPSAFLVYFAIWRMNVGEAILSDPIVTLSALAVGGIWSLLVLASLLARRSRTWLVARRRDWSLSVLVIALCLVVADAALTAFGLVKTVASQRAESIEYTAATFTRFRLVPKDVVMPGDAPVHINNRGYRGPEIAARKRDGQIRMVFLGGSQVFDFYNDWPGMAGEALRGRGLDVEVINAGAPGHDSTDSVGKLLTDVWTLEPDILFLCNAWNDIKYFSWLSPEDPYARLPLTAPQTVPQDWRIHPTGIDRLLTVSAIYRQFRWGFVQLAFAEEGGRRAPDDRATSPARVGAWGPRQYRLNLALAASLARHIGAELVLCKQARLPVPGGTGPAQEGAREYAIRNWRMPVDQLMQAFDICDRIIEEVAAEAGLAVIDMNAALSGRGEYFADSIHFSRAGAGAAANHVAGAIAPIVGRHASSRRRP